MARARVWIAALQLALTIGLGPAVHNRAAAAVVYSADVRFSATIDQDIPAPEVCGYACGPLSAGSVIEGRLIGGASEGETSIFLGFWELLINGSQADVPNDAHSMGSIHSGSLYYRRDGFVPNLINLPGIGRVNSKGFYISASGAPFLVPLPSTGEFVYSLGDFASAGFVFDRATFDDPGWATTLTSLTVTLRVVEPPPPPPPSVPEPGVLWLLAAGFLQWILVKSCVMDRMWWLLPFRRRRRGVTAASSA